MHTSRPYNMQDKAGHQTIAQLSHPTILASSVQAVVACNITAPSGCTLVLFIVIALFECVL